MGCLAEEFNSTLKLGSFDWLMNSILKKIFFPFINKTSRESERRRIYTAVNLFRQTKVIEQLSLIQCTPQSTLLMMHQIKQPFSMCTSNSNHPEFIFLVGSPMIAISSRPHAFHLSRERRALSIVT